MSSYFGHIKTANKSIVVLIVWVLPFSCCSPPSSSPSSCEGGWERSCKRLPLECSLALVHKLLSEIVVDDVDEDSEDKHNLIPLEYAPCAGCWPLETMSQPCAPECTGTLLPLKKEHQIEDLIIPGDFLTTPYHQSGNRILFKAQRTCELGAL